MLYCLHRCFFCLLVILCILFGYVTDVLAAKTTDLLSKSWQLKANRGPAERYQLIDPGALKGAHSIRITYDLHGTCLLGGDASAIIVDQPANRTWRYVSLSRYGKNCHTGVQTVDIPLAHFPNLDLSKPVGTLHTRFWHNKQYSVDIQRIQLLSIEQPRIGQPASFGMLLAQQPFAPPPTPTLTPPTETSSPTPTALPIPTIRPSTVPTTTPMPTITVQPTVTAQPTHTPVPTATPSPIPTPTITTDTPPTEPVRSAWSIQSVSSMKETKDRICWPRPLEFIDRWVDRAVELGANYVSVETPYDNPLCGDSEKHTREWVAAIRKKHMRIWHRHMPLAFEGIYNTRKDPAKDYLQQIGTYIVSHPDLFTEGDIFTPIPEPQNGGIRDVSYCAQGICIFRNPAHFNQWLRDAIDVSEAAFAKIGLGGKMKIGYYGFDGFIAWGDNNPDWDGLLEDATVLKMGNITIDHYPELVGDTMANDLDELQARYPNFPIIIGEWGTVTPNNPEEQVQTSMQAAQRPSVVGFNYWHMGIGGNEELVHWDLHHARQFDEVQSFFTNAH